MSEVVSTKAEFLARYEAASRRLMDIALITERDHALAIAEILANCIETYVRVRDTKNETTTPEELTKLADEFDRLVGRVATFAPKV